MAFWGDFIKAVRSAVFKNELKSGNFTVSTAEKLSSGDVGGANIPVYFIGGQPVECDDALNVDISGVAGAALFAREAGSADYASNAGSAESSAYATESGKAENADYATEAGAASKIFSAGSYSTTIKTGLSFAIPSGFLESGYFYLVNIYRYLNDRYSRAFFTAYVPHQSMGAHLVIQSSTGVMKMPDVLGDEYDVYMRTSMASGEYLVCMFKRDDNSRLEGEEFELEMIKIALD